MAREPKTKAAIKTDASSAAPVQGRIVMESGEDTPVYYINHAEISHTRNDFCLTGGRIPARFSPAQLAEVRSTGTVVLQAEVQLIIPPTVVPGLIRALTQMKEQYEKLNFPIVDTGLPK